MFRIIVAVIGAIVSAATSGNRGKYGGHHGPTKTIIIKGIQLLFFLFVFKFTFKFKFKFITHKHSPISNIEFDY